MLSLYEYEQVVKEPKKIHLMGRNITLTKPDYVVSDIDGSFTVIVKNVSLYFHQKYDRLVMDMKKNNQLDKFEKYYVIDGKPAFYHFFSKLDAADNEIFHLLNRLGVPEANKNMIIWNGDVVKKHFYEEVTAMINKMFGVTYELDEEYKALFDSCSGKYSDLIYDNFDPVYNITINNDLSKYSNEELFDYFNQLLDDIIYKALHIYRNALLLLVIDYIREKDDSYNEIYDTITKKDFINSFYKVETTKNYAKSMMSNIFKYPFVIGNYYSINGYVDEEDYSSFKEILDYLDITSSITETMNIDNHNYIYKNFSLDGNIDDIRKYVKLYCCLSEEDVDTYIARHVLLIQKEEIDRMISTIENEGDINRLDQILEQISDKNKKFEMLFNKSFMTPAELNAIDKKISEQKSMIRQDNYYRIILFIVLIIFVFYEAYKLLTAG